MAGRIEDILQCPASRAITLTHHLQHLDGGNQRGGGEVLERSVVGDVEGLDIEALALHHPEQLLDRPALAKKVGDLLRTDQRGDGMRRQQPPMRRRTAGGVDLARLDEEQVCKCLNLNCPSLSRDIATGHSSDGGEFGERIDSVKGAEDRLSRRARNASTASLPAGPGRPATPRLAAQLGQALSAIEQPRAVFQPAVVLDPDRQLGLGVAGRRTSRRYRLPGRR